ncbi:MAG: HU family DNA-binding protein [bacterium]|nr:HU family DNA-binding protein [Candidatus Sumerlaeota bacterium]
MTKQELIDAVAKKVEKLDVSKTAVKDIIDCIFEEVAKAIKKEKRFQMPGFGTFTVRSRKARTGRNPKTNEPLKIKASKTVGFKPAPSLKAIL